MVSALTGSPFIAMGLAIGDFSFPVSHNGDDPLFLSKEVAVDLVLGRQILVSAQKASRGPTALKNSTSTSKC
ncbi:MAG: hypothetical protein BroJett011_13470 [Chloroflexota bacterium]|nr:MAG: hypothetical protein BroJett011_13470 [Chloroflexota bacterium]